MRAQSLFILLPILGISLISCTNVRPLMDDNVYMMKAATVPVGEDLSDETSYATFKHRQETGNPTNGYYHQANQTTLLMSSPFFVSSDWFFYNPSNNFGTLTGSFNPYWGAHRNGYYFIDGIPGFSLYSAYMGYGAYSYYSPYYAGYGNLGNWSNGFFFNGYAHNNGFNSCYNNGFNNNGYSNNYGNVPSNLQVSSPRGTVSGYYSGNNRHGAAVVRSQSRPTNGYGHTPYGTARSNTYTSSHPQERTTYSRPSSNAQNSRGTVVRREVSNSSSTSGGVRQVPRSGSEGSISNPRSGIPSGGGNSGGGSGSGGARPGGRRI